MARTWTLEPTGRPDLAAPVALPCQWQTVPAFATEDGPFTYAAEFEAPPWRRVHLVAEGTFHTATWRLNDDLLGVHAGAWDEARYDLTDRLRPGMNRLEAVVACPPERSRRRHLATGVFGGWDCLPASFRAGGVWRPVYLEAVGDVRIADLWLATHDLRDGHAEAVVHARVEVRRPVACAVTLRLSPPPGRGGRGQHAHVRLDLPAGTSGLELPITVKRPLPWQPWSRSEHDEADLYDLALTLRPLDRMGAGARRSARVGLRTVARDGDGRLLLNGRPLFVKGWNYGPSAAHLATSEPARIAADVRMARAQGLDALRVHGHVDQPALYRAADRLGVLLFQDGPLQWAYAPDAFPDAAVALRATAARLSAHPSVVELRAHNEPMDVGSSGEAAGREPPGRRIAAIAATFLWSDNRDVWDRGLTAALRPLGRADPGHAAMLLARHSGVIARRRTEDTHLYAGWYPQFGSLATLDRIFRLLPGAMRWVSEFGAQSLPVLETARRYVPARPTAADWHALARDHLAQPGLLERNVGIAGLDLEALVARTQAYQAALLGAYIDRLRSHRFRPTAGFFGFLWADAADGITWSLLDRQRRPKLAFAALAEQLAPLAVVALLPLTPPGRSPRRLPPVPLWLVNDTAWQAGVRLTVRLGGEERLAGEAVAPPESALPLGALAVEGRDLTSPGELCLAWEVEPIRGEGRPPSSGTRRYPLPSPLWRPVPEAGVRRAAAAAKAGAGAGPGAANEP